MIVVPEPGTFCIAPSYHIRFASERSSFVATFSSFLPNHQSCQNENVNLSSVSVSPRSSTAQAGSLVLITLENGSNEPSVTWRRSLEAPLKPSKPTSRVKSTLKSLTIFPEAAFLEALAMMRSISRIPLTSVPLTLTARTE